MNLEQTPSWLMVTDTVSQRKHLYETRSSLVFALAYIHREIDGRVSSHHDLKPKNILVLREVLQISDFGRSHLVPLIQGSETDGMSGLGSFTYHPPEYWNDDGTRAQRPHGRAFDVWSMGCIMVEVAVLVCYGWQTQMVNSFKEGRSKSTVRRRYFDHLRRMGALDDSFHNNMSVVRQWILQMRQKPYDRTLTQFLEIAESMLKTVSEERIYSWEAKLDLMELN